jgi:polyhydroxyalkanoate synthase subunit PhaC
MTLAWLKNTKQETRIKSATFLTTLIDFENAGDLKIFVDEDQLTVLSERMAQQGFMDAETLRNTFNMLRANELIWSFVVNNYLLGRDHFPFDLLYWNSDSTNMPAAMHAFYLRHFYLQNDLAKPCKLNIAGVDMDVTTIKTPAYFLSAKDDHIAPWRATYAGAKLFSGPVEFTLAASGHIAGVVNPPDAQKYSHWVNTDHPENPEQWFETAQEQVGSWWPHWQEWIKQHAGKQVKAVSPDTGAFKPLISAPGEYVTVKA